MSEVLYFALKIIAIVIFAMYFGKKTGVFSLGKLPAFVALVVVSCLFGLEFYSSFFRDDISLVIKFVSPFLNLTLDLSFFLRIFFATLFLGLLCSCLGVRFSTKLSSVKDLCTLAVLIAITVILAYFKLVDNLHDSSFFKKIILYIL